MGDWQALAPDPCSSFPPLNTSTITSQMENDLDYPFSSGGAGSGAVVVESKGTSNSSLLQESCEALSSSGHQCFWNPQSRITGDFCNTCHSACLSRQTSLNFYQFCIGVFLISLGTPLIYVIVSAVTSDITPVASQVGLTSPKCIYYTIMKMDIILLCVYRGRLSESF